jgi:nucleoid-associated protein YgaU
MKRICLIGLLAALIGFAGQAQSLVENSYYKRSLELKDLAAKSFDDGDYDAAADYAAQAQENATLSDKFVAKMIAMHAADDSIAAAKSKIAWADSIKAKDSWPTEYGTASTELDAALAAYGTEDYEGAKAHADAVIVALADVSETLPFPALYTVRLIPARRDCLWNIAGYSFIYNNPLKWPVIYEANKKTFRDPSNPNLIYPGQVLKIPAIKGEARSGTYDPSKTYSSFKAK